MTILKGVSIFNGLNLEQLYSLLNISQFKPFPADYTIIRKGDMGDKFYVVVKGEVGVYLDEEQGPIAVITSGGIFGEMSIIDNDVRTTTVKTFGEALMLEFDGDSFLSMLKKNSDMAYAVAATISQRISSTSGIS
jgi:CRP-like cAMP-binding protein